MSQQDHDSETFLWENELWEKFCNDDFNNSGDDMATAALQTEEDKGRKRSPAVAKKEKGEDGERRERGESSSHDMHIWTERERRKKMRNMFSTLRSLLPDVPPKVRCTIRIRKN